MTKLLLTSMGITNKNISDQFFKLVKKNPSKIKLFLVTTASRKDEDWKYVKFVVKEFEKIGLVKKNIIIFSLDRKLKDKDLEGIDVIHICGGNTFHYIDKIRKTGLFEKIKLLVKKGVVYVGVSAGSVLAGPNIDIVNPFDENDINLKDLTGLNLTDVIIAAHYDKKDKTIIDDFKKKSQYEVVHLTDKQALLIKDKKKKIIG